MHKSSAASLTLIEPIHYDCIALQVQIENYSKRIKRIKAYFIGKKRSLFHRNFYEKDQFLESYQFWLEKKLAELKAKNNLNCNDKDSIPPVLIF